MKSMSTRERLMINAEQLMAKNGIAATSVREITDASDANVAAINYYFGSKNELLLQLLKARFDQLDANLLARLKAAEESAGETPVRVASLAGAYTDALTSLGADSTAEPANPTILLIERAAAEQEPILSQAQDYNAPGITKLIQLFLAAAPTLKRQDLGVSRLIGLMFSASVDYMQVMNASGPDSIKATAIRNYIAAGATAYLETVSQAARADV
ncbi:TetR/AcrR family transcriptional regulator [Roseibium sp.]|uniref:TetR/AcrR family transcriptional regulator n=1 Tax=Roseibium sp. TaxID=1936156 RepID=UPI003A96EF56